jgi:flavodoxin
MQTVIIYDSRFGNTERIANAIAEGASNRSGVQVINASDADRWTDALADHPDLVLIGGPTHNHGPSAGLKTLLERLPTSLAGAPIATFDTRYRGPVLIMGSAAGAASKILGKAGASVVAPAESFFIVRKGSVESQALEPGELERARRWAAALVATVAPNAGRQPTVLAG